MAKPVLRRLWSRAQGAFGKSFVFGLYDDTALVSLGILTTPLLKFRKRTQTRAEAVTGLGTLSVFVDAVNTPPLYNVQYDWDTGDPDTPGIYIVELDALDAGGNPVTFPSDDRLFIRILGDVGA